MQKGEPLCAHKNNCEHHRITGEGLLCQGAGTESWSRVKLLGLCALRGAEAPAGIPAGQGRGGHQGWGPAGEKCEVQVSRGGVQVGEQGVPWAQTSSDSGAQPPHT